MRGQFGVDLGIVTGVAVNIYFLLNVMLGEKRGKKLTSSSFRRDGTQLDSQHVSRLVKVFQCMAITTNPAELLPTTVGKTAGET